MGKCSLHKFLVISVIWSTSFILYFSESHRETLNAWKANITSSKQHLRKNLASPTRQISIREGISAESSFSEEDRNLTSSPCSNYKGLLHIAYGDSGAAAGTLFFQYVINQIVYAEQHQLLPWVHLNSYTHRVWDPDKHGKGPGMDLMLTGACDGIESRIPSYETTEFGKFIAKRSYGKAVRLPGAPNLTIEHDAARKPQQHHFDGTGVWNHYFGPLVSFNKYDTVCQQLPYLRLSIEQVSPQLQFFSPSSVRSWPYLYLPSKLKPDPNSPLQEWFEPQRIRGHEIVKRYYRFQQDILDRSNALLSAEDAMNCLGVHIRWTDKGGLSRRRIELDEFVPYMQAYLNATATATAGARIYIATDSSDALRQLSANYTFLGDRLVVASNVTRTEHKEAVFDVQNHHATNQEVLVDILSLSRCNGGLIHGYSAVSESAIYINIGLNNRSVNLEDPDHMSVHDFENLVRQQVRKGDGIDRIQE